LEKPPVFLQCLEINNGDEMRRLLLSLIAGVLMSPGLVRAENLEAEFRQPPVENRLAVLWFWANAVTKEGITRDLEAMKQAGIGRAVLSMTKNHSATIETNGVVFLSPEWLALFRHALDEADRLGIRISAVMSNGWYQGAPWVTPEMGAQMLVWSETAVTGPAVFTKPLPAPDKFRKGPRSGISGKAKGQFKPVAVLAFRQNNQGELIQGSMVRLDDQMKPDGKLNWSAPDGKWCVFRFAHVPTFVAMKQDSPGFTGLQIDHLSAKPMELYFDKVGRPMLEAAGPHVGKTLDRLYEDSMELGFYDWTPDLPAQFNKRSGRDLIPMLPLLAGKRMDNGIAPERFDLDFKEFLERLLIEEHFGTFRKLCHSCGLALQAEAGETRSGIDTKAAPDFVMDEFWTHLERKTDFPVCLNRNAVFAAHVYGRNRNTCEAFTSHQQWLETPAQLKALSAEAYAMGVNHLTIHGFSYSPPATPPPGDVYFAGTHYNPGVTWWRGFAGPLTMFFNRCQTMLAAGLPVTDLLYLDGPALQEMIKSNEMLREDARRFWKFDGISAHRLETAVRADSTGRLALPDGQTYAVLAVADETIALGSLRKIAQLVQDGATVWFQEVPRRSSLVSDGAGADKEITAIVKSLGGDRTAGVYPHGKGRVLTGADRAGRQSIGQGAAARDFFAGMHADAMDRLGIAPAFAYRPGNPAQRLFFFQRHAGDAEIFFVANAQRDNTRAECTFRVSGKLPERWDPVTGTIEPIRDFQSGTGKTVIPLEFAPYESFFVVFRKPATAAPAPAAHPVPEVRAVTGPWRIHFAPARGGLESFEISAADLFRWDLSDDRRVASFSGTATYSTDFDLSAGWKTKQHVRLDLGNSPGLYELTGAGSGGYDIREDVYDSLCAEVLINGQMTGTLWCSPYRLDIKSNLRPGKNRLEIRVTSTWHNWRLANKFAAGKHPWEQKGWSLPPAPSGLIGPVVLSAE